MTVINYPGSICTAIYDIISIHPGYFNLIWKAGVFSLAMFLLLVTVFNRELTDKWGKKNVIFKALGSWQLFLFVALTGLILLRLPNLILPQQNPDESQWIANAGTFYNGAVLWKSVTGYTGGPLLYVLPCIMIFLGDGLNYTTLRLFGLLFCIVPSVYLVWKIIAGLHGEVIARVVIIPLIIFFAVVRERDWIAYNSEHVAMLMITLCIYVLFALKSNEKGYLFKLFLLGFLLGLVPFSKLQAVPIALTMGIMAIYAVLSEKSKSFSDKIKFLFVLSSAALIPLIFILIYLGYHNAVNDFWNSYIVENLLYANSGVGGWEHTSGFAKAILLFKLFAWSQEGLWYGVQAVLFVVVCLIVNRSAIKGVSGILDKYVIYSAILMLLTYYAVVAPGAYYGHYLLLFIAPFAVFTGVITGKIVNAGETVFFNKKILVPYVLFIVAPLSILLKKNNTGCNFIFNDGNYKISAISKAIKDYSTPNERMSIWGWDEVYNVETGLIQAHPEPHPYFAIIDTQPNSPYLVKFVNELRDNKPVVFLDAVSPASFYFTDTLHYKHENYPLLHNFISEYYKLVLTDEGKRVYVLNSRLTEKVKVGAIVKI